MKNNVIKSTLFIIFFSFISIAYGQDTIRILAIGNSFSEDAAEEYLDDLANAGHIKVIVGNLYWGGCSLQTHWNNVKTNGNGYEYRKVVGGTLTKTANCSIETAVLNENWDYITFQQVSQESGKINTYFPYLTNLLNYVKSKSRNPNVKYCLHRTWAYAANSTHSGFLNYNRNQITMFDSIVSATNQAASSVGIDIIIPAGTAIQNIRTSFVGDNLNRDGYHLSYGLGRYTAACVWYEKLFGKTVVGNTFIPTGVSPPEAEMAQKAAHFAIIDPDRITSMTE